MLEIALSLAELIRGRRKWRKNERVEEGVGWGGREGDGRQVKGGREVPAMPTSATSKSSTGMLAAATFLNSSCCERTEGTNGWRGQGQGQQGRQVGISCRPALLHHIRRDTVRVCEYGKRERERHSPSRRTDTCRRILRASTDADALPARSITQL